MSTAVQGGMNARLLCLVLVLAFGVSLVPGSTIAQTEAEGVEVPAVFIGQWTGTAIESTGAEYQMSLTVTGGPENTAVAAVDYPSFPCSGELILWLVVDERTIATGERITSGQELCIQSGFVLLVANEDDTLSFEWRRPDLTSTLNAELTRVG